MKKIISILLLLISSIIYSQAQTTKKTLAKAKFGTISAEYQLNIQEGDTTKYVFLSFRNMEYTTIIDIGSFLLPSKEKIDKVIEELEACIAKTNEKEDNINYGRFVVYDFSKSIYVYDDSKKTRITAKKAQELADWLRALKW